MLLSISLILIVGMSMGYICSKLKLPSLIGMLVTGIILGPYVLNLLDSSILGISADLRKIALIIILTRAGFGLDLSGLKKLGKPAILMCFVPATFELIGMIYCSKTHGDKRFRSGDNGFSSCGSISCCCCAKNG
ncbi:MAG: cation:proton antiporter [Bulleidia sp.]|nr:cation:proton antiporter [Bulleidia sp.]